MEEPGRGLGSVELSWRWLELLPALGGAEGRLWKGRWDGRGGFSDLPPAVCQ